MEKIREKLKKLPTEPGVYLFRDKSGKILYIGKATNLRSRTQSYFRGADSRGARIASMVSQMAEIDFILTDSVLEALILESNLIKKHQPKYNIQEKDDKSFSYFAITQEKFPRVEIVRESDLNLNLRSKSYDPKAVYGPYTSKKQMEIALKIIRRIFPFHSHKQWTEKGCLDFQIGLCPGPYAGAITPEAYRKNIQGIKMILRGRKKSLITVLEKEMKTAAQKQEFERATELRNKIFALKHIRDISLITQEMKTDLMDTKNQTENIRIEAYDISNLSGKEAVGSMVVFTSDQPNKSQYRKFKIKTVAGVDDVGMLAEVLRRRFKNDWPQPELVLLDGGQGPVNMAEKMLRQELGLALVIAGVAKGPTRKKTELYFPSGEEISSAVQKILADQKLIRQIMAEAHRFAIAYYRKLRRKNFI